LALFWVKSGKNLIVIETLLSVEQEAELN